MDYLVFFPAEKNSKYLETFLLFFPLLGELGYIVPVRSLLFRFKKLHQHFSQSRYSKMDEEI